MTTNTATYYALWIAVPALVSWLLLRKRRRNPRRLPRPPGPKGMPLIGNVLDMPAKFQWKVFQEWKGKYGDMIFLEVLNQPILVLNSLSRVEDLLEKRSLNYSNRPKAPMLRELMGWQDIFLVMDLGPRLRDYRRTFAQYFTQAKVQQYHPAKLECVQRLVSRLSDNPNDIVKQLHTYTADVIAKVVYGFNIEDHPRYIALTEKAVESFEEAAIPGRFLVDVFPFLKYIPSWMPGAGFQRFAVESKKSIRQLLNHPFHIVEENMARGSASSCIVSDMVERLPEDGTAREQTRTMFRHVAGTAHIGGSDTVSDRRDV
ncbi:cytochrome P450 [Coprinopsis cinerea AmutBmut pab1-1]|nr:cytochrome P450 [Coprinopsis cinerea AmutBmut pab1-1]